MKRTMIVTLETEGDDAWRTMEEVEEDLLTYCNNLANSYEARVDAELLIVPLTDAEITEFANRKE